MRKAIRMQPRSTMDNNNLIPLTQTTSGLQQSRLISCITSCRILLISNCRIIIVVEL